MYFHMTGGQIWTEVVRKKNKKSSAGSVLLMFKNLLNRKELIRSLLLLIRRLE